MDLRQELSEQMKAALKAGSKQRLSTVRMLLNELKNEDLQSGKRADDVSVLRRYAKRLTRSIEEYQQVGAADRIDGLRQELAIVEEFLPQVMGEQELVEAVDRLLTEHGLTSPKQMGQAMGLLTKAYPGRVDGAKAQQILRAKLTEP
ncbi:MAG TPA: GatB/YqeY domain-containing protein [Phycisphaerae bacterium]|nr:GatB/YqeY domain-containing protein [Phycisphaerae bacterium]